MTTTEELLQACKEFDEKKSALYALVAKDGPALITKAFQDLLKDSPDVVVYWTQGTPSFNDGDPCYFRVHDMWICPADSEDLGEEAAIDGDTGTRYLSDHEDDEGVDHKTVLCTPEQQTKLYELFNHVHDLLQNAWGDATITIGVDSIEVGDFDYY